MTEAGEDHVNYCELVLQCLCLETASLAKALVTCNFKQMGKYNFPMGLEREENWLYW
jgi:hypothetical protein